MTEEIKVGQKWRGKAAEDEIEVRFVDDDGWAMTRLEGGTPFLVKGKYVSRNFTLIPDTVLVELSVEDAEYLRGFFCVDINGTDGAHNRLYTACKKALDEREGK
jgi:hypothetical protein